MKEQETVIQQTYSRQEADRIDHLKAMVSSLPPRWRVVKLGEIANVLYGKAHPRNDGSHPVIGSGGIFGSTSKPLVEYETLIIGRKGSAGSIYYSPNPSYPSDTTFYLQWKQEVNALFLYYSLLFKGLAPGKSIIPSLQRNDVENFSIPFPPLPEQKAIAQVLQAVEEAMQVRRQKVELERESKVTLLEHLFTYGLAGTSVPTKETKFGTVPLHWKLALLEQCAFVQTGVAKGRKLIGKDTVTLPYLRVANVQDGYLDLSEIKDIELRSSEVERYKLHPGDVVVTEGGDFDKLGRGFLWKGQIASCVHQNHIFAVRVNRELLLPEYFAYLIQSDYGRAYFLSVAHRTTNLASINSTKLKNFPILIPPLEEQRDIVQVLDACDTKISSLDRELALLEELFRTLIEELMTGRISTIPLIEEERAS